MLDGWEKDSYFSVELYKFAIYTFLQNLLYLEKYTF